MSATWGKGVGGGGGERGGGEGRGGEGREGTKGGVMAHIVYNVDNQVCEYGIAPNRKKKRSCLFVHISTTVNVSVYQSCSSVILPPAGFKSL